MRASELRIWLVFVIILSVVQTVFIAATIELFAGRVIVAVFDAARAGK
jgi:hypothetical protein